ncbi:hypothetical protein LNV47_24940, partial [Paucibacter sp. DJ4R-1]|nr:hypothetical protein [Paucibacter sp. DJ4R-1]
MNAVNVDNPLLPVYLSNLSVTTLVLSTDDQDLVVLANREGADIVFAAEVLREGSRHDLPTEARRGIKVGLAALATGRRDVRVKLGHYDVLSVGDDGTVSINKSNS